MAGHGTLAGQLMVVLMNDLTQAILKDGIYDLIDFASYDGTFSSYSVTGLGNSFHYMTNLLYTANGVQLALVVPEPDILWLMLPSLGLLFMARRRRSAAA